MFGYNLEYFTNWIFSSIFALFRDDHEQWYNIMKLNSGIHAQLFIVLRLTQNQWLLRNLLLLFCFFDFIRFLHVLINIKYDRQNYKFQISANQYIKSEQEQNILNNQNQMFDSLSSADLCQRPKKLAYNALQCLLKCKQQVNRTYKSQTATPKISLKKNNKTSITISKNLREFHQKSLNIKRNNLQSNKIVFEGKFEGTFDGEFRGVFQGKFYTEDKQNKNRTQTNSRILCKTQFNEDQYYPFKQQPRGVAQTYKQLKDISVQNFNTPKFIQNAFKIDSSINQFKTHKHSQTLKLQQPKAQKQTGYHLTPDSRDTYRYKTNIHCPLNKFYETKNTSNHQPNTFNPKMGLQNKLENNKLSRGIGYRQSDYIKSLRSNESLSIRDQNTFRMTDQAQKKFNNQVSKYQRLKTIDVDQQNYVMHNYPHFKDLIIDSTPQKVKQNSRENSSIYPNVASFCQKKSGPMLSQPTYFDLRNQISQTSFYGQKPRTNKNILKKRDQLRWKTYNQTEVIDVNRTELLIPKKNPLVSIAKIRINSDKNVNQYQAIQTNSRRQSRMKTTPICKPCDQNATQNRHMVARPSQQSKINNIKTIKTLTEFIDEDVQSYLGSNDNHSDMRNSKVIFSHKKLNANLARLLMLSDRENRSNVNITSQRQISKGPHTDFQLVSLKLLKNGANLIQDANGSIREEAQRDQGV